MVQEWFGISMTCWRWDGVSMDLSMGEILGESGMWQSLRKTSVGIGMCILMVLA